MLSAAVSGATTSGSISGVCIRRGRACSTAGASWPASAAGSVVVVIGPLLLLCRRGYAPRLTASSSPWATMSRWIWFVPS